MSDFLSKFSGDKYTELLETDQKNPENESKELEKNSVMSASSEDEAHQIPTVISAVDTDENGLSSQSVNLETPEEAPVRYDRAKKRRDDFHEEVEIDPTYQKKKKRKLVILVASASFAILVIAFSAYHFTHVTLPNFVGKSITEVREWGNQHQVTIDLTQKYSTKYDANFIISQKTKAGKKIAKGSQLGIVSSLGADPEEVLKLPDFSKMTYSQAVKWVEKNKAENLKVSQEFNETIKKGEFIKLDITNSVPASEYTRGTKATLTYSRGAEVLEANISVPDFNGKQKSEVESWAKTNGIEVTYVEKASSTIATGLVMGQSVAVNEKVAKKSKMEITVSAGKGVTVPDFSQITMGQASSVSGLTVIVRQVYGDKPYGQLISQSQPAGTELTEKDNRNVEVVYSAGTPYIRDLTGKNEGELQQYFYEEFRSKGAEIYFSSYYVNSDQPKGTVVKQSAKETWLPLNYTVNVGISNGAWYTGAPVPTPSTDKSTSDSGETQTAD